MKPDSGKASPDVPWRGEAAAIQGCERPGTVESLTADLRALGVQEGMTVLVHASMSSLGWVAGGAQAVVEALVAAVGPSGTIVMPAFTTDNSEPRDWRAPAVPEAWWPVIRAQMPAFDPARTPTRQMGRIAELFRTWPGVRRSNHPASSFAAWGRHAAQITGRHPLALSLGEDSPLARIHELGGHVLLLGATTNSSLHLAEHRADWPGRKFYEQGAAMQVNGQRQWVAYRELWFESDDFPRIGAAFEATGAVRMGRVGRASCQLMNQRALVDFATAWISQNRGRPLPES